MARYKVTDQEGVRIGGRVVPEGTFLEPGKTCAPGHIDALLSGGRIVEVREPEIVKSKPPKPEAVI